MADPLQVLGVMALGAGSAIVADNAIPQLRTPIPGTTIAVEPGAWIGAGLVAVLALTGKRGNSPTEGAKNLTLRTGVASLAGGMLVWEGGKLIQNQVLPLIPQPIGTKPNTAASFYVGGNGYRAGALPAAPQYAPSFAPSFAQRASAAPSDYQVQAALRGF